MSERRSRWQRPATPYFPYNGHIAPNVVQLEDRSLLAMGHLHGKPHELASAADRNALSRNLNTIYKNIHDDNIAVYKHFVRRKVDLDLPEPAFTSDFPRGYWRAYRDRILKDRIWQNDWFLSVLAMPRMAPVGSKNFQRGLSKFLSRTKTVKPQADATQLEEVWAQLSQGLADHNITRLGLRVMERVHWDYEPELASEIGEALHLILYGKAAEVPLAQGPLGDAIYDDQVVFERRIFRILPPGIDDESYDGPGTRWAVIFGIKRYMRKSRPDRFDAIMRLPMELVFTQSMEFMSQPATVARLDLKRQQMKKAGDPAIKDAKKLKTAGSEVGDNKVVRGKMHHSLVIFADTYPELILNAAIARAALVKSGAVIKQETAGMEAAWGAQAPGNFYWRVRPVGGSSKNAADLASLGAYPAGYPKGRWGDAIPFRTTAGTLYNFIPHVGDAPEKADNGMMVWYGPSGRGKTVAQLTLQAFLGPLMGKRGIRVILDKDRSCQNYVLAEGGSYLEIRSGEDSGMAPLLGLENTPENRQFIGQLVRLLILSDGQGPLGKYDKAIGPAVAAIMRRRPEKRSFAAMRQYLDWDENGAGARLEVWCRGNELGWFLDGKRDDIKIDRGLVGIDNTKILGVPELAAPAAVYQLYRIRQVMDGRPGSLTVEEAWAYIRLATYRDAIEDLLATARKLEWIVSLVAQQPEHLLDAGKFGVMVLNQCLTVWALPNDRASEHTYTKVMDFSPGEYYAVHEGMPVHSHQILLHRPGQDRAILDLNLSPLPEYLDVLSGRATNVREAEDLRQSHPETWVEKFMTRDAVREAAD